MGPDPATAFEPMQRRIERPLRHLDHVGRDLSDPLRDGPAMLRFEGEGAENQQIQGALWQSDARCSHVESPFFYRGDDLTCHVEVQGPARGPEGERVAKPFGVRMK